MPWHEEHRKAMCGRTASRFDEGGQVKTSFLLYPVVGIKKPAETPAFFWGATCSFLGLGVASL